MKASFPYATCNGKKVLLKGPLVTCVDSLEWFSFECRKTKTKVITLANHIGHRQYIEPIKTRSNYMWLTQSAGKSCERVTIGFGFTSDWMKRWRESFKPIASCRKCKTNYFSTLKWKPLYHSATLYKRLQRILTYNSFIQQTCHPTYTCNWKVHVANLQWYKCYSEFYAKILLNIKPSNMLLRPSKGGGVGPSFLRLPVV